MNRDEYLHVLATEPATTAQVGAVIGEFDRLGVVDRAERLAISAELLGLEELGSTTDLVMGDAGRLVNLLRSTRNRAALPDVAAAAVDEDQGDEHGGGDLADDGQDGNERITWPEAFARLMVMIYAASWGKESLGEGRRNIATVQR
jgi:hypothetical protein